MYQRILITLLLVASAATQATPHPQTLQPTDIFNLEFALSPEFHPDGEQIAYVRQSFAIMTGQAISNIWTIDTDGNSIAFQMFVESDGLSLANPCPNPKVPSAPGQPLSDLDVNGNGVLVEGAGRIVVDLIAAFCDETLRRFRLSIAA